MYTRTKQGAISVVIGSDPLTSEHIPNAQRALEECLADGQPRAVLDMQGVALIDSSGLELLLDIQDAFESRAGSLKLAATSGLCREILAITGIASRFEQFPEVKSAVGSFVQ